MVLEINKGEDHRRKADIDSDDHAVSGELFFDERFLNLLKLEFEISAAPIGVFDTTVGDDVDFIGAQEFIWLFTCFRYRILR